MVRVYQDVAPVLNCPVGMPEPLKSAMALDTESAQNIDRFFTAIKSLNELDKREIRNVVDAAFNPTERETYVTLNYHRAAIISSTC